MSSHVENCPPCRATDDYWLRMEMPQTFKRASLFQVRGDKSHRSGQLLLWTILVLTPTPQVLPLINGIASQLQRQLSQLFSHLQSSPSSEGDKRKRYEKFANGGLDSVSLFGYHRNSWVCGIQAFPIKSRAPSPTWL